MTHKLKAIRSLCLLCLSLSPLPALAAIVTLTGTAPDYAGVHIVLSTYADYLSRLKRDLVTIEVDQNGKFNTTLQLTEVTYALFDLSYYEGYLYLEPGSTYHIVLPPRKLRPDADRFNPFYQPTQIEIGLRGSTTPLNAAIRDFDLFFGRVYFDAALRLVRAHDRRLADQLITRCDSAARATHCDKQYFRQHVTYRQAQLYAAPRLDAWQHIIEKYYSGKPVLYNLPAYWQTIDMLNPDILSSCQQPDTRKAIRTELRRQQPSLTRLTNIVAREAPWTANQTLREALIIRSLQRLLFDKQITSGRADTLLMSATAECDALPNRLIAANIYARKNKLREGLPAPPIDLMEGDKHITLQSLRGQWLYLCFMHSENYECIKAFPALDNLARLHTTDLRILCIFTDDNADEMRRLLARQKWAWQAASYISNQRIMFDYDVRALPTYFLIDPDGRISKAQAPGPLEKIGPVIATAIRDYKVQQKRGQVELPRTIYDIANGAQPKHP